MTDFNTVQYCLNNNIPCFTFYMDTDKQIYVDSTKIDCVAWKKVIKPTNFRTHVKLNDESQNGFAIITGHTHFIVDFDLKHNPPQEIFDFLMDRCQAIERTPGGYHFWYRMDDRSSSVPNVQKAYWNGVKTDGLDIRAHGGIAYCDPSHYIGEDGETKCYKWYYGDLSCAEPVPDDVLECILAKPIKTNEPVKESPFAEEKQLEGTDELLTVLNHLSPKRADDYTDWITVGAILKHEGMSCELWDTWSKQSYKYKSGECLTKWKSFDANHDRPATRATLYKWLKEDNSSVFYDIQFAKKSIQTQLLAGTQGDIASVFYQLDPYRYLFSDVRGWYIRQENNTWRPTNDLDISSIPNILNIVRQECTEAVKRLMTYLTSKNELDNDRQKSFGDIIKKLGTAGFLKGVTLFLKGLYHVIDIEKKFNQKIHLFAFTNGVIDLNTMEFRQIVPDDYITVTCNYPFRPIKNEEITLVWNFLSLIFPIFVVLEYNLDALSRSLRGQNSDQVFHVCTGCGANGKSCLMYLCKLVFGDYYQTFSVSYLTKESDGKDRPLPELASAQYSRMLVTSEPDDRDRFQINMLKSLTGDEEVTFRGMYAKNPATYVPQFSLWILANDVPKLSRFDRGITRRMRCIHFPTRFCYNPTQPDEQLRDDSLTTQFKENEAWRYGMLGLLFQAYNKNRGPLVMPDEVKHFTNKYLLKNNPVGQWLDQKYEITGSRNDIINKRELFNAFIADNGNTFNQKTFPEEMKKNDIEIKIVDGIRYYWGIKEKPTGEEIDDEGVQESAE
jgi:P4 family phage/plasmid primase-like protien